MQSDNPAQVCALQIRQPERKRKTPGFSKKPGVLILDYAYAKLSRTLILVALRAGRIDAKIEITSMIASQAPTAVQLYA